MGQRAAGAGRARRGRVRPAPRRVGGPGRHPGQRGKVAGPHHWGRAGAPEGADGGGLPGLRRRFAGWHDPIPALLEAADPGAVLHDDLYELPPLAGYTRGRVALAGDAAHAMTPNLGQGAGQALEDAVVLAKTVGGPSGLDAYDRLRRPRTQKIALRSHRIGVAAQWASPAAVTLRNTALRLLPGSSFIRSLGPVLD